MTKYQFLKESKGLFNSMKKIGSLSIARVGWLTYGWIVLNDGENFANATDRDIPRTRAYRTALDLFNAEYKK